MRRLSLLFALLLLAGLRVLAQTPAPHVSHGTVRRFEAFPSKFVASRTVDVWLPDGYPSAGHYDVLYMHDGQMLFDSTTTWNHQEWRVDEVLGQLEQSGAARPTIVVSSWNSGATRHADYFPQAPLAYLPDTTRTYVVNTWLGGHPLADAYLRFLTQELKPFVDRTFAVRRGRAHTFVMGSSMGGLISLYALCEYPKVFGGAACLSTHWPGIVAANRRATMQTIGAAFQRYMREKLPSPATHRLYFDYGTATLDSLYAPYQQAADAVLRERGYSATNWTTRAFPGADHSERSWARRLDRPLLFLLGKQR